MGATGYTSDPRTVASVEDRTGAVDVVKADVGLGNVDNTADADKPVSSATQTALDGKSATSHNHDGTYSASAHNHSGVYANASHAHSGADVTSGTVPIGQLPTGTSGTTVALGNHTHAAGAWTAISSFGTNMTAEASGTYYVPGQRTEPNDVARLRGRIQTAQNYSAGATICTLDASYRPAKEVVVNFRSGGTGAAAGFLTIATTGVVTFSTAITVSSATAWFHLDALSYSLAV